MNAKLPVYTGMQGYRDIIHIFLHCDIFVESVLLKPLSPISVAIINVQSSILITVMINKSGSVNLLNYIFDDFTAT